MNPNLPIYFHENQLLHRPKTYLSRGKMREPQEKPERMYQIIQALKSKGYLIQSPKDFGIAPITEVHSLGFVDFLKNSHQRWMELQEDWGDEVMSNVFIRENNRAIGVLAQAAKYLADGSAPIGPDTWKSVYWSAQTALACAEALLAGEKRIVGLTRPAGHHARYDAAGGFCYLNNAAIMAHYLSKHFPRIAIVDTDMHHGQGVQEIFYRRKDVLYVSVHGDPVNFYPVVAGFADEHGEGEGFGYNRNYPLPHGSTEETWLKTVDEALDYAMSFAPDILIHISGFDVYYDDPQAKVKASTSAFTVLGDKLKSLNLPMISLVEGGYHVEKLGENMLAFMQGFDGE